MTGSLWGSAAAQPAPGAAQPAPAPSASSAAGAYGAPAAGAPAPGRPAGRGKTIAAVSLAAVLGFAAGAVLAPTALHLVSGWSTGLPGASAGARPGLTLQPAPTAQPGQQAQPGQGTQPGQQAQPGQGAQPAPTAQPGQSGAQPGGRSGGQPGGQPGGQSGQAPQDVQQAVRGVVDGANAAQAQAIASGDPSGMADTATTDYYRSMVQTNKDLVSDGVKRIELMNTQWGPITVQGDTATATTTETWRTTYSDGTTDQSTDRNVYTLVRDGGAWKIQSDEHPDNALTPPGGLAPGAPTLPVRPGSGSGSNGGSGDNGSAPTQPRDPSRQGSRGPGARQTPGPGPRGPSLQGA